MTLKTVGNVSKWTVNSVYRSVFNKQFNNTINGMSLNSLEVIRNLGVIFKK